MEKKVLGVNIWIVNKLNSTVTSSFLFETILKIRESNQRSQLLLFMDNAKIHNSQIMKTLAKTMKTYFLINCPNKAYTNKVLVLTVFTVQQRYLCR